jgi:hypothetical protein
MDSLLAARALEVAIGIFGNLIMKKRSSSWYTPALHDDYAVIQNARMPRLDPASGTGRDTSTDHERDQCQAQAAQLMPKIGMT